MRLTIDLHDQHYALLEQQAAEHYREPKQHAAWLIAYAVSATATAQADVLTLDLEEETTL